MPSIYSFIWLSGIPSYIHIYTPQFLFFLREGKKKRSEGEEERGRKRGRENGNVALF